MLPLPDLNDQNFEKIVAVAKKQIKNIFPQWTDNTPHDPGVTFIELLAHLQAEQRRKLNEVSVTNRQKLLELFSINLQPARPAVTEVMFSGLTHQQFLPKGTKLKANNLIFETTKGLSLTSNTIKSVLIKEDNEQSIIESNSIDKHRTFNIFGKQPEVGNQFLIGFNEPFAAGEEISLKFNIYENYPIKRNPLGENDVFVPITKLSWEYFGEIEGEVGWYPLEIAEDTTINFLFSGYLICNFKGKQLKVNDPQYKNFNEYCFRCTLLETGYEVVPKMRQILLNCTVVEQKNTLSESFTFTFQQVIADKVFMNSYLAYYGKLKIFYKQNEYWVELADTSQYKIVKDPKLKLVSLQFNDLDIGAYDENETEVLKIIAAEGEFANNNIIGGTTGFANQCFDLPDPHMVYADFRLFVGRESDNHQVWQQWTKVKKLASAEKTALCYELDESKGVIRFGNNEHGFVPVKSSRNLMIIDYALTEASKGNINAGMIEDFYSPEVDWEKIKILQITPATGGKDTEKITEAEIRLKKELQSSQRAVNEDDFIRIVLNSPGLMIKNIKVLPLYKPGMINYPERKADNCVTLVVEPYSEDNQGKLTDNYLKNIKKHINKYRLITTKVYIVQPQYIGLDIYGELIIKSNFNNAAQLIEKKLLKFIEKIQEKKQQGMILSYSDIYGELDLLACVSAINYLAIEPSGYHVTKTNTGNIIIPPIGRIFLRKNNLVLVNKEQL